MRTEDWERGAELRGTMETMDRSWEAGMLGGWKVDKLGPGNLDAGRLLDRSIIDFRSAKV